MLRGASAVDRIIGDVFERHQQQRLHGGESGLARRSDRFGGSQRRPSVSRMSRVGARDGKAIFKLVRSGGTKDRAGLRGQMRYVFNDDKLARVIDPLGRVAPDDGLDDATMHALIRNWSADWWDGTRNGQTSHMILSYPQDASIDQVEKTTRDLLDDLLGGSERRFKYIAGVHDDQEHHPHVHVIVNRRASDNSLFTLRSGTELSYERFREAMAYHGERHGLQLDPTFRFERGETDRQPSYDEQLKAQVERRAPAQRPRSGVDLDHQKELIAYARIAYEAMAVIAHNADCQRLETAYQEIANIIEEKGEITMQDLNPEEMERFDQYTALLGDGIARAETLLEDRDPAARVAAEKQLNSIMQAFTALSPDAPYAKELHMRAESSSIYMHGPGENAAALKEPDVREALAGIAREYGLSADVVEARLEAQAENKYLDVKWLRDDLAVVAAKDDLDLETPEGLDTAKDTLRRAYDEMRDVLVPQNIIAHLPHLDDDYVYEPQQTVAYVYIEDRLAVDVADVVSHYRENGAPAWWINDNKAQIRENVSDLYKERAAAFAAATPAFVQDTRDFANRDGSEQDQIVRIERLAHELEARGLARTDPAEMRQVVGEDLLRQHPGMPHQLVDQLTDVRMAAFEVAERSVGRERDREIEVDMKRQRDRDRDDDYER